MLATEYAIYKGDTYQAQGTAVELAKELNVKVDTILFYASPANKKRDKGNRLIAIRLEDD